MTDLIVRENNLPTTPEDLSKFVLVGRDKLQAVRAEISALKNLDLAKEVREQKLAEGQEIGKLVLLAEARLGELFNQTPKATANNNVSGKAKENTQIPAVRKLGNAQSIEIDDKPPTNSSSFTKPSSEVTDMVQKILLTLEIDDAALDAAQAKADKLVATLKQAEAFTDALRNAVAGDCDDFADRIAAVKALAKEKAGIDAADISGVTT